MNLTKNNENLRLTNISKRIVKLGLSTKKEVIESKVYTVDEVNKFWPFIKPYMEHERKELLLRNRIKELGKIYGVSYRVMLCLYDKCGEILKDKDSLYSMGSQYHINITDGKRADSLYVKDTCMNYPNSFKYRATHGYHVLTLSIGELGSIEMIGGVPTIIGERVHPKVRKCKILITHGAHKNFKFEWIDSYLTSNFHSATFTGCLTWRNNEVIRLKRDKLTLIEMVRKTKRFIGFQHSIDSGNCIPGTINFCERHNLNIEMGYNLGYILSLEDSVYTRRLLSLF